MNWKNFLFATGVGFFVYFMLGWLFYGKLFPDIHPHSENTNMMFIALGCLFYSATLAYIFCRWSNIATWMTGAQAGALIGLLSTVSSTFFMFSAMPMSVHNFIMEIVIMTVSSAVMGAAMGWTIGWSKSQSA